MANKKNQYPRLVSPRGIASFPHLTEPDTKFDAKGKYTVGLRLDPKAQGVREFLDDLDRRVEEALTEAQTTQEVSGVKLSPAQVRRLKADPPYAEEYDRETGEETGFVIVKFACNATFEKADRTTGNTRTISLKPLLVDGQAKPIEDPEFGVYGGDIVKVSFEPRPYFAAASASVGVSRKLYAVQIIEQAGRGRGKDGAAYGFQAEEGAFEHHHAAPAAGTSCPGGEVFEAQGDEADADDIPF